MEAETATNQAEGAPVDEGWIEVPSKRKKKEVQQQPGNQNKTEKGVKNNRTAGGAPSVDEEQKKKWTAIEDELKAKVVTSDDFDWSLSLALAAKKSPETQSAEGSATPSNSWSKVLFGGNRNQVAVKSQSKRVADKPLSLLGGAHVSYFKNNPRKKDFAVVSLVVCSFPALEVVYEAVKEVRLEAPFISGFLSFRDVGPLVGLFNELKETKPELVPQLILVDGPGVLYRGFGLATHLGVLLDVPTVGVTKKFFTIDGLTEGQVRKFVGQEVQKRGEAIEIIGRNSGNVLGAAMRTADGPRANHIYVSVGHRISLATAVEVVREACTAKLPQPIYFAEHAVKQELQRLDPKAKSSGPAGNKDGNRRNDKGPRGPKKGVKGNAGATNGVASPGKGQGQGQAQGQGNKRPRGPGPKGQGEGGQGGNKGPRGPRQGQGQGGQGQGQGQGGQGLRNRGQGQGQGQSGNKGPRPQGGQGQNQSPSQSPSQTPSPSQNQSQAQPAAQGGQGQVAQAQGQAGQGGNQQGKRTGGQGQRGGNRNGGAGKQANVWTQKTPSGQGAAGEAQPAAQPAAKQGGQKQGGGQQQQQKKPQQQQPQGEKGGEKQQQPSQPAEKKD